MIVRLHNLSVRAPVINDVSAVAELINGCDSADSSVCEYAEVDIRNAWQALGFNLRTDAWVIVTNKGRIIGYADVRQSENDQLTMFLRVHPDFRGRGIGTLLVWLVEERARQRAHCVSADMRVTLRSTVRSLSQTGHGLLEREGYTQVHSFWRIILETDEVSSHLSEKAQQSSVLKLDIVASLQNSASLIQLRKRTGMYLMRQYDVYEKELRAGKARPLAGDGEGREVVTDREAYSLTV